MEIVRPSGEIGHVEGHVKLKQTIEELYTCEITIGTEFLMFVPYSTDNQKNR